MAVIITGRSSAAWLGADFLKIVAFISLLCKCHAVSSCLQDPEVVCENCTTGPEYDLSTNCRTCVEPRLDPSAGCTECVDGETQCYTGHFTFSALFQSYMNPQHLCGECAVSGPLCCDTVNQTFNCSHNCSLRLALFVQPFGAAALDVVLPRRPVVDHRSDIIPMFIQGPSAFIVENRSNPYTVELKTWMERLQFYIVVYDFYTITRRRLAIDRFLINLELGAVPNAIPRQTYHGIHNISQFDLSFNIRCSENYYGPHCSIFCSESGVYTCDAMGNRVCAYQACDIGTACLVCTTTSTSTTSTTAHYLTMSTISTTARNLAGSSSSGFLGGVICAIIAVTLILSILAILLFLICRRRKLKHMTGKCQVITSEPRTFNAEDKPEIETEECVAYGDVSTASPAVKMEDCVAYGQALTVKPEIQTEQCVAYENVSTVRPEIQTEQCVAYKNVSTVRPEIQTEQCVAYENVSTVRPEIQTEQCTYENVSTVN